MRRQTSLLLAFLLPLAAAAQTVVAASEAPKLDDYAWGFPILADGDASFYSVQLPLEFNQSVTDPELRDAGVYNNQGSPVPRVFAQMSEGIEETESLRPLPMLPLYANSEDALDDIDLLLEHDGDITTLRFSLNGASAPAEDTRLSAYVVDTRELAANIDSLEFDWAASDPGFIGQVSVDASDNLRDWELAGSGAIAHLQQDSASIVQRRVKLDRPKKAFLRIRWQEMPDDWRLSGVRAVYKQGVTRVVRELTVLQSAAVDETDHGRIFDLGGAPLVDQVRPVLSEANSVVNAEVFYWSDAGKRWVRAGKENFYNIGRGSNTVVSGPMAIGRVRAAKFKVVVLHGQTNTPMQLELGWRPDTLLFLAQGSAPFVLAAGRASDAENRFPQQTIYGVGSIAGLAEKNGKATAARLGPRFALGGPDRLSIPPARNWPTITLWIGLALGIGFVGFMAAKIVRDQKNQQL